MNKVYVEYSPWHHHLYKYFFFPSLSPPSRPHNLLRIQQLVFINFFILILVPSIFIILYYDQQKHNYIYKLPPSYMFRYYRVILREFVFGTSPSHTSILNAADGNAI